MRERECIQGDDHRRPFNALAPWSRFGRVLLTRDNKRGLVSQVGTRLWSSHCSFDQYPFHVLHTPPLPPHCSRYSAQSGRSTTTARILAYALPSARHHLRARDTWTPPSISLRHKPYLNNSTPSSGPASTLSFTARLCSTRNDIS